ncbi:bola-like protein [Epithele typhae]|uniref:bola-like protein n=1 Tax=Epithele typhae TaxID=378194 RepID=UPI002008904C|nr:bola-like protein [Epithele typhae]KAH9916276.1 bola-like protein [Epithele typhae]
MPISAADLEASIRSALPIIHLEIEDTSSGCGENYSIFVVSEAFEGKNTLARHRFINEVLKSQIAQMHAFSQKTLTPTQYRAHLAKQAA